MRLRRATVYRPTLLIDSTVTESIDACCTAVISAQTSSLGVEMLPTISEERLRRQTQLERTLVLDVLCYFTEKQGPEGWALLGEEDRERRVQRQSRVRPRSM